MRAPPFYAWEKFGDAVYNLAIGKGGIRGRLFEAFLSFLGLGIQPPATSWGLDVANGKNYLFRAWWLVTMPGIAIAITVLAINLVASWMRLISDPQEREKQFARQTAALRKRRSRRFVPMEETKE